MEKSEKKVSENETVMSHISLVKLDPILILIMLNNVVVTLHFI